MNKYIFNNEHYYREVKTYYNHFADMDIKPLINILYTFEEVIDLSDEDTYFYGDDEMTLRKCDSVDLEQIINDQMYIWWLDYNLSPDTDFLVPIYLKYEKI
jgi:hypothetical protein